MLVNAAVVPGPPAFVAELMGSAAYELDGLRNAADCVLSRTVSDLVAASSGSQSPESQSPESQSPESQSPESQSPESQYAESPRSHSVSTQLVVVGPGRPGEFNAAGPVSFAGFGQDVAVPALVEGPPCDPELPTPLLVARYLASRDVAAHPEHAGLWASARWITTRGADATALGKELRADARPVALILVADGATCHGPKAPRAQDMRAKAYDAESWAALASGQPGRLGRIDAGLGDELGATGPQVWPVLVAAAGTDRIGEGVSGGSDLWVGDVLWSGAPYGVGWAVAGWRRPARTVPGSKT